MTVPRFVDHLPKHGGMPIPFFIARTADGVPNFRVIDSNHVTICVEHRRCGICGRNLGEYGFLIGGNLSYENHLYSDPPMHQKCAKWANEVCPYLADPSHEFAEREVRGIPVQHNRLASTVRPKTMWLVRVRRVMFVQVRGERLILADRYYGAVQI